MIEKEAIINFDEILLKTGAAADYLGVSVQTLRNYEERKLLVPIQVMPSGHRRYSLEQLDTFIEKSMAQI